MTGWALHPSSVAKLIDFPPDISELRGGREAWGETRGEQDQCDQDCLLCERETGLWMMMIAYRIFAGKATALSVICSPHNNSFWVHSQLSASSEHYPLFCYFYQNASAAQERPAQSQALRYTGDTNYHNWNREHEERCQDTLRFLSQNKARLGSGKGWARSGAGSALGSGAMTECAAETR